MNKKNNGYVVPLGPINKKSMYGIEVQKAEESFLYDANGKRYLDLRSGLWNVSLGYNKDLYTDILKAFQEQLNNALPFLDINSYDNKLYSNYSDSLLEFINKDCKVYSKVFYTNSGSEGTELATKLVRHLNPAKEILTYDKSYHGTFFAGISASGIDEKITEDYSPKLNGFITIQTPKTARQEKEVLEYIEQNHKRIAAVLFEPIIGSGGVFLFRKEFLNKLDDLLKKYEIILIFDEVATGFYRTGKRFYFMEAGIYPDILLLSKSINNGILPFGAVVVRDSIAEKLEKKQIHIEHFSTQNGNLLGIKSAESTLNYLKVNECEIISNVTQIEASTRAILSQHHTVPIGTGGMFSVPINNEYETLRLIDTLKDLGILCYYYYLSGDENGLTLFPPLLIDIKLYEKALKVISRRLPH